MIAVTVDIPNYVLMERKSPIGPKVALLVPGIELLAIYGFADKDAYDRFCAQNTLAVTPFPLVKGYLQRQTEISGERLKLVVIDAVGPAEPLVYAATMEAVLHAVEHRTTHVTVTHHLTFDREADAYRVEVASA